jgi:hypothetical protein
MAKKAARGKRFVARVMWGTIQTIKENDFAVSEYRFRTQAELDAFWLGVREMDGWLEYRMVEHGDTCPKCDGYGTLETSVCNMCGGKGLLVFEWR